MIHEAVTAEVLKSVLYINTFTIPDNLSCPVSAWMLETYREPVLWINGSLLLFTSSEIQLLKVVNVHQRLMAALFVTSTLMVLLKHNGIDIIGKH